MKILIPWEGAANPEVLIRDLHYAGLPAQAHTLVLSVVHVLMPVPARAFVDDRSSTVASNNAYGEYAEHAVSSLQEERDEWEVQHARTKLAQHFPGWFIEFETLVDDRSSTVDDRSSTVDDRSSLDVPASRSTDLIVERARAWNADLIVIGSERRTRSLAMAAARIAEEAACSVRIVHPRHQHPDAPLNVLLYVDGTAESLLMVEAFAARSFPRNTRLHLISVVSEREWNIERIHHMLDYFADHVRQGFPCIESQIRYGDPAEQILRYAKHQEIDSIFIAALAPVPAPTLDDAHGRAATMVAQEVETTVEIFRKLGVNNDEGSGRQ
jgi:nucleotide-binding universal stress UspA family protein